MEDGKEKQNDEKSLNATFSNELNNQRHETSSGEEPPQSKRTKSRRNNSEKKRKNKPERQEGQAPKLPPRGYSENECQPLIGVLNRKNDTDRKTKKGEKTIKRPYKKMAGTEEGKKYSAPIIIKGKNKSLICSATIDCGSYASCISKKMHQKLKVKSEMIEPIKVESAKGELQIKERIWLKVNFGSYVAKMPFNIIDDPNYQSSLIIIGSDFLKQTDCTIKLAQKSMWIENRYHVRLYTDKEKMIKKLEQIKNTLTRQVKNKEKNKKPDERAKLVKRENRALH